VSTQINVTVDSGGLSDKARQLQTAARQAQLEKERTINLSAEALDKRVAAQAAKGLSPDGLPLYGPSFKQPQIERRPAATRFGSSKTVMSWILFVGDANTTSATRTSGGLGIALENEYKGTNNGWSLYLSSTDGTYWLNAANNVDLQKPEGFRPGDLTSRGLQQYVGDTPSTVRFDDGAGEQDVDIFPVGSGNFVVTFRFNIGRSKAWWNTIEEQQGGLGIEFGGCVSSLIMVFKSFLVSKSIVKQVNTPQGVKDYFENKFPQVEPRPVYWRQYFTGGPALEVSETPQRPDLKREVGPAVLYVTMRFTETLPRINWLNGWWQRALPPPQGFTTTGFLSSGIQYGTPAVYSRVSDATTNLPVNGFSSVIESFAWWDSTWVQDQTRMKKPIAHYLDDYSITQTSPMSLVLPIYEAIYARPEGTQWRQGITPKILPTDVIDPPYWRKLKDLSFSPQAQPFPVTTLPPSTPGTKYLCVATDWSAPSYCRQQALALGFLPSDLTP
jgi:hypothetical protein